MEEWRYFVDEQRIGSYRFWYLAHRFEPVPGGIRMSGTVHYRIGYGRIGSLLHRVWIRCKLENIFGYRRQIIFHKP